MDTHLHQRTGDVLQALCSNRKNQKSRSVYPKWLISVSPVDLKLTTLLSWTSALPSEVAWTVSTEKKKKKVIKRSQPDWLHADCEPRAPPSSSALFSTAHCDWQVGSAPLRADTQRPQTCSRRIIKQMIWVPCQTLVAAVLCCRFTTHSLKVDPVLQIIPQVPSFHPGQCLIILFDLINKTIH